LKSGEVEEQEKKNFSMMMKEKEIEVKKCGVFSGIQLLICMEERNSINLFTARFSKIVGCFFVYHSGENAYYFRLCPCSNISSIIEKRTIMVILFY